ESAKTPVVPDGKTLSNSDTPSWVSDKQAPGAVIIEALGNSDINQGSGVLREFKPLVGARLPLSPVPDLLKVQGKLDREYPHLQTITKTILERLSGQNHVRLRPLLFVGPAGSGKTSYAQSLLMELGVPS